MTIQTSQQTDLFFQKIGNLVWEGVPYAYDEASEDAAIAELLTTLGQTAEAFGPQGVLASRQNPLEVISIDGPARNFGGKDSSGNDNPKVPQSGGTVSETSMRARPWSSSR